MALSSFRRLDLGRHDALRKPRIAPRQALDAHFGGGDALGELRARQNLHEFIK